MTPFEHQCRTRIVFGPGALSRLGDLARELGFRRTLLVSDAGILAAGYAARAASRSKRRASRLPRFQASTTTRPRRWRTPARRGREAAIDSLVGLGGGSSMDCAKAIDFVLTNGGPSGLPGLRQGGRADAAGHRRPHDRRDRQRGPELRAHLRRDHAREDGLRRPRGRLPRGHPRSRAAASLPAR